MSIVLEHTKKSYACGGPTVHCFAHLRIRRASPARRRRQGAGVLLFRRMMQSVTSGYATTDVLPGAPIIWRSFKDQRKRR